MGKATNSFAEGVVAMARDCLAATELVKSGRWSVNDVQVWLKAVIDNDVKYLDEIRPLIMARANAAGSESRPYQKTAGSESRPYQK